MPTSDTSPEHPEPTAATSVPDEHLDVLAEAVRDDSEHYEDPPATD